MQCLKEATGYTKAQFISACNWYWIRLLTIVIDNSQVVKHLITCQDFKLRGCTYEMLKRAMETLHRYL